MKSVKIIFFFTLFTFPLLNLSAQEKFFKSAEEARAFSQKTVVYFKDNNISSFFKEIKPYWPLPENELDGLQEKTTQYMNLLLPRLGKTEDVVKIREENIKDFVIKETYLLKFENSAVRLTFFYYKNNKGWVINGFTWNDDYSEEFKSN